MRKFKKILKQLMPAAYYQKIRYPLLLKRAIGNHIYDAVNFISTARFSYTPSDAVSFSAILTMEYHKLEKALTLPQPKKIYGITISENIIKIIKHNLALAEKCPEDTATAIKVLEDYCKVISNNANPESNEIVTRTVSSIQEIKTLLPELQSFLPIVTAGVSYGETCAKNTENNYTKFLDLISQRKTVRNFSEAPIPREFIINAIDAAKYTPSVCNRQPWKAYYLDDRKKIKNALRFQNGNSGFGDTARGLLIVTSSTLFFPLSGERNQAWIDGGMFSMSLLLALNSCGLGACALNWGNDSHIDRAAKKSIGLPETDNIIMMIALGYPQDGYKVCASHRRETKNFVEIL